MNRIGLGLAALALAVGGQALSAYAPSVAAFFDFFLVMTVYYAVTTRQVSAMLVGAGCGLVQDVLLGTIVGLNGFAKALLAYLIAGLGNKVLLHQTPARLLVLAVASILHAFILFALHQVLGEPAELPGAGRLLGAALGNAALGALAYRAVRARRGNVR
jgi:rod shape-determining protein MreD